MTAGSVTNADEPNPQDVADPIDDLDLDPAGTGTGRAPTTAKRRRRKPVRRTLIVTHRWISLVLGLVLLVITTSGAILLYRPEIQRWLDADAYAASGGPATVSMQQAQNAVAQAARTTAADE